MEHLDLTNNKCRLPCFRRLNEQSSDSIRTYSVPFLGSWCWSFCADSCFGEGWWPSAVLQAANLLNLPFSCEGRTAGYGASLPLPRDRQTHHKSASHSPQFCWQVACFSTCKDCKWTFFFAEAGSAGTWCWPLFTSSLMGRADRTCTKDLHTKPSMWIAHVINAWITQTRFAQF